MKSQTMAVLSAAALLLLVLLFAANPGFVRQNPIAVIAALVLTSWKLITWLAARSQETARKAAVSASRDDMARAVTTSGVQATVCVYRPSSFIGSLNPVVIYCDGAVVADLKNGSYVVLPVPPGRHVFTADVSASQIELTIDTGSEHFIRAGYTGLVRRAFEVVTPKTARAEMGSLSKAAI